MMTDENTLAAMHAIVRDHVEPKVIRAERGSVLVTSDDVTVHDLDQIIERHLPLPSRARGVSTHHTLQSLIDHADRHKSVAQSVVFCDVVHANPSLHVVYNYQPKADGQGDPGAWRDHGAQYTFPLSDQWKRWTTAAGKSLTVEQFAQLLEDGIADIRDPASSPGAPVIEGVTYATPSELLTLSNGLAMHVSQEVVEQVRLDNGTARLVFAESHDARNAKGEPVRVPNGFLLGIPVFVGGDAYAVPARLRYRVANKQVTWTVVLQDAEAVKRTAVTEAAEHFASETSIPLFMGTAE